MQTNDITEYNEIFRENNELYRGLARAFGLSDCVFWILYTLREAGTPLTQSGICSALYEPKQTIHSALKKMSADGLVTTLPCEDRRSRPVALTPQGVALSACTADVVLEMERAAFAALSPQERTAFVQGFRSYTAALRGQIQSAAPTGANSRKEQR